MLTVTKDQTQCAIENPTNSETKLDLLDELERVHLQLGLLEYRASAGDDLFSHNTERLFELGEEVKCIIQRVSNL